MTDADSSHSLYAAPDGTVWGWGDDALCRASADPDRDTFTRIATPTVVRGLDDVVDVAVTFLVSFALRSDGTLLAWGSPEYTGVGDGTTVFCGSAFATVPPQPVLTGAPVTDVAVALRHALALRADGRVASWGAAGSFGVLGRDTSACPASTGFTMEIVCTTPGLVDGLEGIVAIATAATHSLALDGQGRVWAWGENGSAQLGFVGPSTATPVLVSTFPDGVRVVGIAAGGGIGTQGNPGEGYSLALAEDGTVWAWGANRSSVFGDPTAPARSAPALVPGVADVVAIATNARHVLALDGAGVVHGWGLNVFGQVGVPEADGVIGTVAAPTAVLADVDAIAAGFQYSLARGRDGTLWGWGHNNFYQVGASPIPPDLFPPFELREPVPLEPPTTP